MDDATVTTIAAAMSDATRIQVLRLSRGQLAVGEIATQLGVSSATVSHHLAVLTRAGLVRVVARGRRHLPQRTPDGLGLLARALG